MYDPKLSEQGATVIPDSGSCRGHKVFGIIPQIESDPKCTYHSWTWLVYGCIRVGGREKASSNSNSDLDKHMCSHLGGGGGIGLLLRLRREATNACVRPKAKISLSKRTAWCPRA
jgi:hypothetical protein